MLYNNNTYLLVTETGKRKCANAITRDKPIFFRTRVRIWPARSVLAAANPLFARRPTQSTATPLSGAFSFAGATFMSIFDWLFDSTESLCNARFHSVNPANGLPMLDDTIDVAGNPFGTDLHDPWQHDDAIGTHDDSAWSADSGCSMDAGYSADYGCSSSLWD